MSFDKTLQLAEIDALWEFEGLVGPVPVIFEVTFKPPASSSLNASLKRELVSHLYDQKPFICKVRPIARNNNLGLHNGDHEDFRTIIIPDRKEFARLAKELFEARR